jgi:putative ABC transport system substrate-binding protein
MHAAARTLGLATHVLHASTERDFDMVFATLVQLRVGALAIGSDPFFTSRTEQLAALALRHAVPAIFQFREFAAAGGLMSYGSSIRTRIVSVASTPAASSRARTRRTCRCSNLRKSNSSST